MREGGRGVPAQTWTRPASCYCGPSCPSPATCAAACGFALPPPRVSSATREIVRKFAEKKQVYKLVRVLEYNRTRGFVLCLAPAQTFKMHDEIHWKIVRVRARAVVVRARRTCLALMSRSWLFQTCWSWRCHSSRHLRCFLIDLRTGSSVTRLDFRTRVACDFENFCTLLRVRTRMLPTYFCTRHEDWQAFTDMAGFTPKTRTRLNHTDSYVTNPDDTWMNTWTSFYTTMTLSSPLKMPT